MSRINGKVIKEGRRVLLRAIKSHNIPREKGVILKVNARYSTVEIKIDRKHLRNRSDDGIRVLPYHQIKEIIT